MSAQEVQVPLSDGHFLAASLYLPDPAQWPQPCLLEALPYRKDDQTSSYAESYRSLCENQNYAVARVDVRGTGSSSGRALDEYQPAEQRDLAEVISWLADQPWCDGQIGMFGTSYSGFNSLQMACEQPASLKAICAIYATDDRWTDDVHWRGGALRLIDLVDYCHYMSPMCVLPPVPAVWGDGWREEWLDRLANNEPWLLTWLRQNRPGDYWDHGSVRLGGQQEGYERIQIPTMLVAGWADGYRNNTYRTIAEFARQGTPHRLLVGPWAHADATRAMPGPRIDLEAELVAWFDFHLRGIGPTPRPVDAFIRTSTEPEPDLDEHAGYWVTLPSVPPTNTYQGDLLGPKHLTVRPDVGTAAWIDCAGHLPWGLSTDQRRDDSYSLTWDSPRPPGAIVGHPTIVVRVSADAPAASLSVKLCDVAPDGTSALICRGSLDLTYRAGLHQDPAALTPGEIYEVSLELDACAYELAPSHQLRVSVAGSDWPNTCAPPQPVELVVHGATLRLPLLDGHFDTPVFKPGASHANESSEGVTWRLSEDVLTRETSAHTEVSHDYEIPHGGRSRELYRGRVQVNRRTFAQSAHAETQFELAWPEVTVKVASTLDVSIDAMGYHVTIETAAEEDGVEVSRRVWQESINR